MAACWIWSRNQIWILPSIGWYSANHRLHRHLLRTAHVWSCTCHNVVCRHCPNAVKVWYLDLAALWSLFQHRQMFLPGACKVCFVCTDCLYADMFICVFQCTYSWQLSGTEGTLHVILMPEMYYTDMFCIIYLSIGIICLLCIFE